ncbi:MAG: hypothetical protein RLZZ297_1434 [Chloroflexota bacterium]
MRALSILVQQAATPLWYQPIELTTTTQQLGADPRALGVIASAVSLRPTTLSGVGTAWVHALLIGLIAACLAQVAAVVMRRRIWRVVAVVVPCVALCAAGFIDPWGTLPFLWLGAVIAVAAVVWYAVVSAWRSADEQIDGRHIVTISVAGWWVLVAIQSIQAAAGLENGVRASQLWLALIQVGAIVVLWRLRRRSATDWRDTLAIALAVGAVAITIEGWWYALGRDGTDFWILFRGVRTWARGGSLYDMQAVVTNHVGAVFKVPPWYAVFFVPFVEFDGRQVLLVYKFLSMGLFLMVIGYWWWTVRPPLRWGLLVVTTVLAFRPVLDTIANGQIDIILLACLLAAYTLVRRRFPFAAGVFIALATMLKIYPVLIVAFFVMKKEWRAVIGTLCGLVAINALAVLLMGWEPHRQYVFDVLPRIGGTTSWIENQTIAGFLARLVDTPFAAHVLVQTPVYLAAMLVSTLVIAVVCLIALRSYPRDSTVSALQYGMFVVVLVCAVPAAWVHYQTVLVAVVLWLAEHLRTRRLSVCAAYVTATALAVLGFGNQWSFHSRADYGVLTTAGVSYKLYALLVLLGVLGWLVIQSPPVSHAEPELLVRGVEPDGQADPA